MQHETLEAEQFLPTAYTVDKSYWSLLPSARIRLGLGEGARLGLSYNARTQTPSASQLQDVIDNSNPLLLTTGNPELAPSTTHSAIAIGSPRLSPNSASSTRIDGPMLIGTPASRNERPEPVDGMWLWLLMAARLWGHARRRSA